MKFWKVNQFSLFLVSILILRTAYSTVHTWSCFWSCKSLWSDLVSVAFPGWMEPCFFWAFFCVGFIIMSPLLVKSSLNTGDEFFSVGLSEIIDEKSLSLENHAYILREAKWRKWLKETWGRASTWRTLCVFKGNCCVGPWYASLLPLDRFTVERHKLNSFGCSFEAKSVWLVQPLNGV